MKLTRAEHIEQVASSPARRFGPLGVWRSEGPWLWGPITNPTVQDGAPGAVPALKRSLGDQVQDERSLVPIFREGLLG